MINKFKEKIGEKAFKKGKGFGKYLFIGILWTLLTIFFMWLFIDIFKFSAIIGSSIVVVFLFVTRYYAYLLIGLINPSFLKYASTSIGFSLSVPVLMWLFIDIIHIPIIISSTIVAVGVFTLRFIVFDIIGLIKNE